MFDDIIKNKANSHESPVPPDAWDNIVKKKKKRRAALWWWGGAALLLLGLSTAGYFFIAPKKSVAVSEMKVPATPLPKPNNAAAGTTTIAKEQEAKPVNNTSRQVVSETNNQGNDKNLSNSSGTFTSKKKIAVSITNAEAAANEQVLYKPGKKSSKQKGRLSLQQTAPQPEEEIIISKKDNEEAAEKTISNKKEKITVEDNNITTTAGIADKETAPAGKDDKKTAEAPEGKTNDKKENNSTKKHWFIEAMASPLLSSSTVEENIVFNRILTVNNSISVYNGKLVKTSIEPAVAFSLAVRRELNKKFSIGTGLQYLLLKENISIQGKETNTISTPVQRLINGQLVADTVITVTEGTRSIDAVNSYQLISIPVFAQYNIVQKKQWSIGAVGGVYLNLSSQYQNEIDRNAAAPLTTGRTEKNTGMGMDLFTSIRVGKRLGKRLEFFTMPSMRWNLTKYNIKNSLLNKNIRQAGVGFGICYRIK